MQHQQQQAYPFQQQQQQQQAYPFQPQQQAPLKQMGGQMQGGGGSQQQQGGQPVDFAAWGMNDATAQFGMQLGQSAVAAGQDYVRTNVRITHP